MKKQEMNSKLCFEKAWGNEWRVIYPKEMNENYDDFQYALELIDNDNTDGIEILENLIKEFPNEHIDAYVHLGWHYIENLKLLKGKPFIERAFQIAESIIPREFDLKTDKILWGDIDNRALLRAFQAKGVLLMEEKQYKDAVKKLEFLIRVNPNDNQGIRYLLTDCYFSLGKFNAVVRLFSRFQDDFDPTTLYCLGLVYYMKGNKKLSRKYLLKGIESYPRVAIDLISSRARFPEKEYSKNYGGVLSGGEVQAFEYRGKYFPYWKNSEGSLDFLEVLIPSL